MALVEGCKHRLEISVPVAEVERETERVISALQAKVRLPGFRPGKAPVGLVKTRFAKEIRQDVLEALLPRHFKAALERENLKVVGQPALIDVHLHAGEPLEFKAEFEVAPDFELGQYLDLVTTYAEPVASDADVAQRLEQIREQKAEYVNEDPRPLADGDYAVISLESLSGVEEKVSQEEMTLKIADKDTLPAITENLRGASPDETREFDIAYPEEHEPKNLAGRTVRFRALIKAVRRKELPELNDEFAKDLGDFQTLDELKDAVRKNILGERERRAKEAAKHELLDRLVEGHDFPVPDAYVDRQIDMNLENELRALAAQGVDARKLDVDWNQLRESQKGRAARDVKASLLLDKIGDREAIGATQDEIDREVNRIARQQREAVAVTRAKLQKDGVIGKIAGHIRTEKTLNFLFDHARKEPPTREPET